MYCVPYCASALKAGTRVGGPSFIDRATESSWDQEPTLRYHPVGSTPVIGDGRLRGTECSCVGVACLSYFFRYSAPTHSLSLHSGNEVRFFIVQVAFPERTFSIERSRSVRDLECSCLHHGKGTRGAPVTVCCTASIMGARR